jgi:hypothetical protein
MNPKRKPKAVRTKQRKAKKTKPYSTSTARANAALERSLNLLSDLRRGKGSYSELLRKHRLSTRTAHKYLGRDLLGGTHGKPVRAQQSRQTRASTHVPQNLPETYPSAPVVLEMRQSFPNFFATATNSFGGKLSAEHFEAKWRGVRVAGEQLFADVSVILGMADADVLKLENLYASTGGER